MRLNQKRFHFQNGVLSKTVNVANHKPENVKMAVIGYKWLNQKRFHYENGMLGKTVNVADHKLGYVKKAVMG